MSFTSLFGGQNIYPSQLLYLQLAMTEDVELSWPLEAAPDTNVVADIIEIASSTGAFSIVMPDARNGSNGVSTLVNNRSVNTITIEDNLGNTIGAVPSGEVWQFYLASNATQAGTWRTFEFGTGVSSATAAALAGAGLKAIATTLNLQYTPRSDGSSPVTVVDGDRAKIVQWTGGVGVMDLPDPATLGADWFVMVRNNGSGNLTITPAAGTIDSGATLVLTQAGSAIVYTDGTNYFTIGLSQVNVTGFDFVSINVAGTGTYTLAGPTELNRISYRFTGVLTGNRIIEVPTTVQQYWVDNATSGAFTLTVKTALGTGVVVPQGAAIVLSADGTNVVAWEGAPATGLIPTDLGGTGLSTYAQGDLLYATAAQVLARLAKNVTATRYLSNTGASNAPAWDRVNLANGVQGLLPFANLADGDGLSVLGRSTNSSGVMGSISGAANSVLRVNAAGTVLSFGGVNLSSGSAVTGTLFETAGGTGQATYAQGDLLYASAANTLARLAKDTGNVRFLSNQGATNGPAWLANQYGLQTPLAASYTLAADDAGVIQYDDSGVTAVEIPTNASVAFRHGTTIPLSNGGAAGNMTITPAGGVTLYVQGSSVASFVLPPGYNGLLWKVGDDVWVFFTDAPIAAGQGVLYAGYITSAAGAATFNTAATGWAASNPGVGVTRVTHNLGLSAATSLAVVPTVYLSGAGDDRYANIIGATVNSFDIGIFDVGTGNVDDDVFFHATRIAA